MKEDKTPKKRTPSKPTTPHVEAKAKPEEEDNGQMKKKKKRRFTEEETKNLIEGVEKFGVGHWKNILNAYKFDGRSCVDLKDKWRNIENSRMRSSKQKPTSTPTSSIMTQAALSQRVTVTQIPQFAQEKDANTGMDMQVKKYQPI